MALTICDAGPWQPRPRAAGFHRRRRAPLVGTLGPSLRIQYRPGRCGDKVI